MDQGGLQMYSKGQEGRLGVLGGPRGPDLIGEKFDLNQTSAIMYCLLRSRLRTPGVLCLYSAEYPGSLYILIQGSCLPMSLGTPNPAVLFNRSREVCNN